MSALPCVLCSTVLVACSVLKLTLSKKPAALLANLSILLMLFGGAWKAAYSQQAPQHLRNHLHREVSAGQAPLVGSMASNQQLNLAIVLPLRNTGELASLLRRVYDPSSPDYRHFLTVAQFTEQFGPTVEDYETVVAYARNNGLTVTNTPANRLIVPPRGKVDQIDRAFNLKMNLYQHPTEDRTFFSPYREPSL